MYKIRKVNDSPGSVMRDWEIYYIKNNIEHIVASVPKWYKNSEGIAAGICKLLNEGNIILPLEI